MNEELGYILKLSANDIEAIEWALSLATANGKEWRAVDPALMAAMLPRVTMAQTRMSYVKDVRTNGVTHRTPGVRRQEAAKFLAEYVGKTGAQPWREISWAGQQAGLSDVTMRRVRDDVLRKLGTGTAITWGLLFYPK